MGGQPGLGLQASWRTLLGRTVWPALEAKMVKLYFSCLSFQNFWRTSLADRIEVVQVTQYAVIRYRGNEKLGQVMTVCDNP